MERKGDIYVLMVGGMEEKRLKRNLKTRFLFVGFERLRISQKVLEKEVDKSRSSASKLS